MEITKEFHFEMAHVLTNHQGLCGNLHGHSYRALVSFIGPMNDISYDGMIIDFNDVKDIIGPFMNQFDHCFAFNTKSDDPFEKALSAVVLKYSKRYYAFPFRTTAENMSQYMVDHINQLLDEHYGKDVEHPICNKVQLYETASGSATACWRVL